MTNPTLFLGDCLKILPTISAASVDLILCDLPYGTTEYDWDKVIPFEPLWEQYNRVAKPKAAIVLTASQPFTTDLISSNRKNFRYEIIWEKTISSGWLDSKKRPLKGHENICVFYRKLPTYNPQKFYKGTPSFSAKRDNSIRSGHYGRFLNSPNRGTKDGMRFPTSVLKISNHNGAFWGNVDKAVKHPTQKPVALFEWLIKTYTNEGETVLDNAMGSGTTGVACKITNRQFIGIEKNKKFYEVAVSRINEEVEIQNTSTGEQSTLF